MTAEEILALLDEASDAVHEQFEAGPRRDQFDSHLSTVKMCVEHLFDEAARHAQ